MSQIINPKPHLLAKRYPLPKGCNCQTIVMREVDSDDEIDASVIADAMAGSAVQGSAIAAMVADKRESVRLSILAVDGVPVNVNGVPFQAMDGWTTRTMRMVHEFYGDLNGVTEEELKNAVKEAEVIGTSPDRGESEGQAPTDEPSDD